MTLIDMGAVALGLAFGGVVWRWPGLLDRPVALAALWAGLLALPYWILGPASLVGGADEVMLGLPSLLLGQVPRGYDWGPFAGFEPGLMSAGPSAAAVGLEPVLVRTLPLWLAQLTQKLVMTAVAFAGGFLLGRKASGSVAIAAICGLWAAIPGYGYTNSLVIGASMAGMPLAAYVVAGRLGAGRYWGPVLVLALVWPLSNLPLQLVPAMALSWLVVAMILGGSSGTGWLRLCGGAAMVLTVLILNWAETIIGFVQTAADLGRHFQKSPSDVLDNLVWVAGKMPHIWQGLAVFIVILAVTGHARWLRRAGLAAAVAVLGPALQLVPFGRLGLAFLDGFNFNYVLFALGPVSVVLLAEALASAQRGTPGIRPAVIPALAAGTVALMTAAIRVPDIISMIGVGGLKGAAATAALDPAKFAGYRTITVPIGLAPPMTAANGLDTFDGYNITMPKRLRDYWDLGILGDGKSGRAFHGYAGLPSLHHYEGPVPFSLESVASLRLLRLANVGFVVSRVPVTGPDLSLVEQSGPANPYWSDDGGRWTRVRARMNDIQDGPALHVYRLDGAAPRVFLAAGLIRSRHGFDDPAFYQDLAAAERGVAVLDATIPDAAGLAGCCGPGEFVVAGLDGHRLTARVVLPQRPGLLIVNAAWTRFHRARVDGRDAETLAVNGFQIGIPVPAGRHEVVMDYHRPSLWEMISRTGRPRG